MDNTLGLKSLKELVNLKPITGKNDANNKETRAEEIKIHRWISSFGKKIIQTKHQNNQIGKKYISMELYYTFNKILQASLINSNKVAKNRFCERNKMQTNMKYANCGRIVNYNSVLGYNPRSHLYIY